MLLDYNGNDRVIAFFSKSLSSPEADFTAIDCKLLGLIYFLQRFRCYLDGSSFEILTDNQVLKHFFPKPKLSRKGAKCVETLGNFGIFPFTLKTGKLHVLGDALSRASHPSNKSVKVAFIEFNSIMTMYEKDQSFGPIVRALDGKSMKIL